MVRSRPFGVFILVLCLVACVCAHGNVSEDDAAETLEETKAAAKKTRKTARDYLSDAEGYLKRVNALKKSAERHAAAAAEAAKGNQEAEAIAKKVKNASDQVLKLYTEVSASAKTSVDKMKPLVTKARDLDTKATAIEIETETSDGYAEAKQSAEAVKIELDALDKEIKTASGLRPSHNKLNEMSAFVDTAVLAECHVDAIVAVAKFETVVKSADNDTKLTEQKRDEIAAIEKDMKEIYNKSPTDLIPYFSILHSMVRGHLSSASDSVAKAKQAKEGILELKEQANGALAKVAAATDIDEAWNEVGVARRAVKNAEEKLKDTKNALQSAEIEALNALQRKEAAVRTISGKDKKPDVPQDNKKTNSQDSANTHQPVQAPTESPGVIETKQPTIPNPDQSMTKQSVKDTTESPSGVKTEKPTVTNPDQPGSGGTGPTQPSSNDSAMIVCVPLLLALIACAALH